MSAASLRAWDAFFSPSAAITLALASLAASASAAMALWSCSGSRASFLKKESPEYVRLREVSYISTRSTLIPQAVVASSRMV